MSCATFSTVFPLCSLSGAPHNSWCPPTESPMFISVMLLSELCWWEPVIKGPRSYCLFSSSFLWSSLGLSFCLLCANLRGKIYCKWKTVRSMSIIMDVASINQYFTGDCLVIGPVIMTCLGRLGLLFWVSSEMEVCLEVTDSWSAWFPDS